MPRQKLERCPCCGYAALALACRPERSVRYRNTVLALPPDLPCPTCKRCKYESQSIETLSAETLEGLYRNSLCERAILALQRLKPRRPKRKIELLLNLSQGYLSRLSAGDGVRGAPLVSLLALLAAHPDLIDQLESYWTLPPGE
jgi:hypothetical protein